MYIWGFSFNACCPIKKYNVDASILFSYVKYLLCKKKNTHCTTGKAWNTFPLHKQIQNVSCIYTCVFVVKNNDN